MSDKTKIEWCDSSWNPIRGCSAVSDGCRHCYSMGVAARFSGPGQPYEGLTVKTTQGAKWTGKIMLVPSVLTHPIRWQRPRKIFVNSMSDLFHEGVPDSYIDQVFAVMALAPRHIFQVLTKRPERMRDYCNNFSWERVVKSCTGADGVSTIAGFTLQALQHHFGQVPKSGLNFKRHDIWPLPNVWLGVSVEDQAAANERIPLLLQTSAAVRWLSMEPLLGPVDLSAIDIDGHHEILPLGGAWLGRENGYPRIDWVVVGGESGPKARPMHPTWARVLRDQCADAGVPFLFKQWGEWAPHEAKPGGDEGGDLRRGHVRYLQGDDREPDGHFRRGDAAVARIGKKAAGRMLDNQLHDGYPADAP